MLKLKVNALGKLSVARVLKTVVFKIRNAKKTVKPSDFCGGNDNTIFRHSAHKHCTIRVL